MLLHQETDISITPLPHQELFLYQVVLVQLKLLLLVVEVVVDYVTVEVVVLVV